MIYLPFIYLAGLVVSLYWCFTRPKWVKYKISIAIFSVLWPVIWAYALLRHLSDLIEDTILDIERMDTSYGPW